MSNNSTIKPLHNALLQSKTDPSVFRRVTSWREDYGNYYIEDPTVLDLNISEGIYLTEMLRKYKILFNGIKIGDYDSKIVKGDVWQRSFSWDDRKVIVVAIHGAGLVIKTEDEEQELLIDESIFRQEYHLVISEEGEK